MNTNTRILAPPIIDAGYATKKEEIVWENGITVYDIPSCRTPISMNLTSSTNVWLLPVDIVPVLGTLRFTTL